MGEWGNNGEDHKQCIYGNQANFSKGTLPENFQFGLVDIKKA